VYRISFHNQTGKILQGISVHRADAGRMIVIFLLSDDPALFSSHELT